MSSRHRECISVLASFAEVIFILVLELPVCPSWKPSTLGDQFPYIIIRPCMQLRGGGFPFIHVTNPLEAKQKNQRKNRIRSSVLEEVDARTKDPITNQDRKMLEAIKTLGDSECAVTVSKLIKKGARVRYSRISKPPLHTHWTRGVRRAGVRHRRACSTSRHTTPQSAA